MSNKKQHAENINVIVVGQPDHGKSTLIGRLLYEANALPEEIFHKTPNSRMLLDRQNNLTVIFDRLRKALRKGDFKKEQIGFNSHMRRYEFTYIANHKEFLRKVVAEIVSFDAAIIVVDATHKALGDIYQYAYLISMFGIKEIIIAISKMDLKLYNKFCFWELSEKIGSYLDKFDSKIIDIVPISASHGDNVTTKSTRMRWNTSPSLARSLDYLSTGKKYSQLPLRLMVQCHHITNGETKIIGRITSGQLFENTQIDFAPVYHNTKIISIEVSSKKIIAATTGELVTLILEDVTNVERGQIGFNGCSPPIITDYFISDVFWIDVNSLKIADRIDILCGTQHCSGYIETISGVREPVCLETNCNYTNQLAEFQVADVRIKLDSPICVDAFDKIPALGKFTIIQNNKITGAGIIK